MLSIIRLVISMASLSIRNDQQKRNHTLKKRLLPIGFCPKTVVQAWYFMKHDLKWVLKYKGGNLNIPPTDVTDIIATGSINHWLTPYQWINHITNNDRPLNIDFPIPQTVTDTLVLDCQSAAIHKPKHVDNCFSHLSKTALSCFIFQSDRDYGY